MENVGIAAAIQLLQRGVGQRDVIPLIVDITDRFPVDGGAAPKAGPARRQHARAAEIGEILRIGLQAFGNRGLRPGQKAQEDKALPDVHLDRFQAKIGAVHVAKGLRPRRAAQGAVQIVYPAVERADHRSLALARQTIHHPRAAMTAQVVKRPHHPILPAHHQRAFAQQIKAAPVAGGGDVIDMAGQLPVIQEKLLAFQFEQRVGMIGPGRQAAPVPVIGDGLRIRGMVGHAAPSIWVRIHC